MSNKYEAKATIFLPCKEPYLGWRDLYDRIGATDLFRSFARATGQKASPANVSMNPEAKKAIEGYMAKCLTVYKPKRRKDGSLRKRILRPKDISRLARSRICAEGEEYGPTDDESVPYGSIRIAIMADTPCESAIWNIEEEASND